MRRPPEASPHTRHVAIASIRLVRVCARVQVWVVVVVVVVAAAAAVCVRVCV